MDEEIEAYKKSIPQSGRLANAIDTVRALVPKIVMVDRLRRVSVLTSYHRLFPPQNELLSSSDQPQPFLKINGGSDPGRAVPVDNGTASINWLPGVENFGEGIFLVFNRLTLANWQDTRIDERCSSIGLPPGFLVIHTLSHILMRQLAFECGYPLASISERIYFDNKPGQEMSGLLIYTAAGDQLGTLGGLARQAKPARFFELLVAALETARWCSNDPLCMENVDANANSRNLAACHSCALVPETSCELFNSGLDRALLIGNEREGIKGYFETILD